MDNIIGRKLDGRYEIQEIIGIGGMAVVYKAYDSIDDREVAVKVLKEEYLKNDDFRRRFKNESKAVAVLSHPNIVKVYDVSFGERIQYIVMEYIDGITLKEYIDQQKVLTWKEAVHFTVQILRALQHAHERGIVHRDIKPQNIMMLEDGTIKVTDFGIARFAHSETRTMTDKAIGSVHYISPEQARGGPTDEKSDIYSVGVMLYEMLTGQLPFEAENAVSVAIMQMQEEPKLLHELNPQVPEGLEEITLHAMQKDPELRYASAAAMLEDIERFKRNPSIHFQYHYFVDESPTKYVDAIHEVKGVRPGEDAKAGKARGVKTKERKSSALPVLAGLTAALLVVVVAMVFGMLYVKGFLGAGGGKVTVPNLVGQQYSAAQAKYTGTLTINRINTEFSSTQPAGVILKQNVDAGTKVAKNATVGVTVSSGPQQVEIPDVRTYQKAQAVAILQNAGFVVKETDQYDDSVASGSVISTEPSGGQMANYGSTVTILVSEGQQPGQLKQVPDLTGKTQDEATRLLLDNGLKVGTVDQEYSATVAAGKVCRQDPSSTAQIASGEAVNFWISKGPQPSSASANTSLPPIAGKSVGSAKALLTAVGFSVGDNFEYGYSGTVAAGDVLAAEYTAKNGSTVTVQDGSQVPTGTKLTLILSQGPESAASSSEPSQSSSSQTSTANSKSNKPGKP